jgi:nucleotide-binding universal stress UspA family protein
MQYILVPTDFSPNAECALYYAAMLAKPKRAKVVIMHCKELYDEKYARYKSLINEYNKEIISELNSKLEGLKNNIEFNYQIPVSILLYEDDDVVGNILLITKDFPVDFIVMGTYGNSGIRRKLLGSKSAEIINKCTVPVITVPPDYKSTAPSNIAIAVDENLKQPEILKPVFNLADLFNSNITGILFSKQSEKVEEDSINQTLELMEDRFKISFEKSCVVFLHLKGEELLNSLNQYVMEKRIDLLVMITRKRSSFQNLFDRSVTQRMSYNITTPLLSLHQED